MLLALVIGAGLASLGFVYHSKIKADLKGGMGVVVAHLEAALLKADADMKADVKLAVMFLKSKL